MKRLHAIYVPKGLAREYAELALNPFLNCDHGCKYCYSPRALHKNPEEFHGKVTPRKDIIQKVEHDAATLEGDNREILLSFACDIYSPGAHINTTTEVLRILLQHGLNINLLTKGGNRSLNDFGLLKVHRDQVRYGTSLVFENDVHSRMYEPFAAPTSERISLLKLFEQEGFKTWVSLEPIWSANDTCKLIDKTWKWADHYKIGKLNHHPHAKEVNWKQTIQMIVDHCDDRRVDYTLKKDTAKLIQ